MATKPITALVKTLVHFDSQRDAIAPEWERLHGVNAALADDLAQHALVLFEARGEVERRKQMSKELRVDAGDLRAHNLCPDKFKPPDGGPLLWQPVAGDALAKRADRLCNRFDGFCPGMAQPDAGARFFQRIEA